MNDSFKTIQPMQKHLNTWCRWITLAKSVAALISVTIITSGGSFAQTANIQTQFGKVKFETTQSLDDKILSLNGAGLRTKMVFKVYAAGFYTEKKVEKDKDAFDPKIAKRLRLVMMRNISGDEVARLFIKSAQANFPHELKAKTLMTVEKFGEMFAQYPALKEGDVLLIDYVPSKGISVTVKGIPGPETYSDPDFHTLLMGIWFGPKPADESLKAALLGKQSKAM
jgi:Chalcone isomerase-like